ncbi:SLOG family protein [candidate division CSSED10-310 bacterium]|uniref:SLOG family protein n=1 Tax=candidate division CSSED10-310 bacterium TaxID=2855610 RepID=A0ABV6YSP0_UNCC1
MIEIRFCDITTALKIDELINCPKDEIVKGIKRKFGNNILDDIGEQPTAEQLQSIPIEGLALSFLGVKFQSQDFLSSVIHALGAASVLNGIDSSIAFELGNFIFGKEEFRVLPKCLAEAGVKSVLSHEKTEVILSWITSVDKSQFIEEVEDMFGNEWINSYSAALTDLKRLISTSVSKSFDLCVWSQDWQKRPLVAIFGDEKCEDTSKARKLLENIYVENKEFILVSGGNEGIERIALEWSKDQGLKKMVFILNKRFGSAARVIQTDAIIKAANIIKIIYNKKTKITAKIIKIAKKNDKEVQTIKI